MPAKTEDRFYILFASLFIFSLPFLFLPPLWGSSEAREAHIVQEILRSGEWILPTRNGLVPSKPPLLHWLGALIARFTGLEPLYAARFVSLLAALAFFFVMANFLKGLAVRAGRDVSATVLSGLSLMLLTYGYVHLVVDARVDMLFAAFVVAAISHGFFRLIDQKVSTFDCFLMAILCGFAALSKGPLGIVLPAIILLSAGFVVSRANGARNAIKLLLGGALGVVAIAVPWYGAAATQGGGGFIERQLLFENLRRFLGGDFVNSQPWYFYFPVFISTAFPWSLLFLYAVVTPRYREQIGVELRKPLIAWIVSGFILFSAAAGKRGTYLLPLLPAIIGYLALCFGERFAQFSRWNVVKNTVFFVTLIGGVGLIIIGAFSLLLRFGFPDSVQGIRNALVIGGLELLVVSVLCLGFSFSNNVVFRTQLIIAAFVGILLTTLSVSRSIKGEIKQFEIVANSINAKVATDSLTIIRTQSDELFDPVAYYLNRRADILLPTQQIKCGGFFVLRESELKKRTELLSIASYGQLNQIGEKPGHDRIILAKCA